MRREKRFVLLLSFFHVKLFQAIQTNAIGFNLRRSVKRFDGPPAELRRSNCIRHTHRHAANLTPVRHPAFPFAVLNPIHVATRRNWTKRLTKEIHKKRPGISPLDLDRFLHSIKKKNSLYIFVAASISNRSKPKNRLSIEYLKSQHERQTLYLQGFQAVTTHNGYYVNERIKKSHNSLLNKAL